MSASLPEDSAPSTSVDELLEIAYQDAHETSTHVPLSWEDDDDDNDMDFELAAEEVEEDESEDNEDGEYEGMI